MIFLHTFLYYSFFASAVLFYGISNYYVTITQFSHKKSIIYFVKILMNIFITSTLAWLVTYYILMQIHLEDIFPLVTLLLYVCVSAFLEALIRLTAGKSTSEFLFSYLVILLSVMESTSIVNTLVISASCIVSVIIMIPLIVSFGKRLKRESNNQDYFYGRLFIFMAIILLIISVWDALWFNSGVLK